jgi:glutathione synthase
MEGGGHNFYGENVKTILMKAKEDKDALENVRQFLIMERISPPEASAFMLRKGQLIEAPATLQELGIYSSVFINSASKDSTNVIEEHTTFGKLLRTKAADSDEGGVVAGFSVVD